MSRTSAKRLVARVQAATGSRKMARYAKRKTWRSPEAARTWLKLARKGQADYTRDLKRRFGRGLSLVKYTLPGSGPKG